MRTILLIALLAACTDKSGQTKPVENKSNGAARDPLVAHATAFFMKIADAMDAGDCEKVTVALEAAAGDAKALHDELAAANKKLKDMPVDPAFTARMQKVKEPGILDRCEKEATDKTRLSKALDNSLLTVVPLLSNPEEAKGFAQAFGKAFAPTSK